MRLLLLLGAFVLLGVDVRKAAAQGQDQPDKVRVVKFLYDPQPAPQDVVVFKYPEIHRTPADLNYVKRLVGLPRETIVGKDGVMFSSRSPIIERITVEGGKVEISGGLVLQEENAGTGEYTLRMGRNPASGKFADGMYQGRVKIDDQTVALINWDIGTPK